MSSLGALSALISSGVASIEATYAKNGEKPPTLEDPFRGPGPLDVEVMQSAAVVIAAAGQLIATLRLPPQSILDASAGVCIYIYTRTLPLNIPFGRCTAPPHLQ
jgi:hypothetical protein